MPAAFQLGRVPLGVLICLLLGASRAWGRQAPQALRLTPTLTVDMTASHLGRPGQVFMLKGGGALVSQPDNNSVVGISATGVVTAPFGQRAVAIAGMRSTGGMGLTGDTLWVYNGPTQKTTLFAPDHSALRTVPNPAAARGVLGGAAFTIDLAEAVPVARDASGNLLYSRPPDPSVNAPAAWKTPSLAMWLLLVSPTGQLKRFVGTTESSPCTTPGIPIYFCGFKPWAASQDGARLVFAHGIMAGADSGRIIVTALSGTGDTLYRRAIPFVAVVPSAREIDSIKSLSTRGQPADRPEVIALRSFHPTIYAPIYDLVVGSDGTAWLALWPTFQERGRGEHTYEALDATGAVIGMAKLPRTSRLLAASRSALWVLDAADPSHPKLVRFQVIEH